MFYRWILNRFCYFFVWDNEKNEFVSEIFLWSFPRQHFVWYPIIMYSVNSPKSSLVICFYYRNDHTNSPFLLCLNALYTNSTRITRGDRPALAWGFSGCATLVTIPPRSRGRDCHCWLGGGVVCYWPPPLLLLIVSRAKVATPNLEIRIRCRVSGCCTPSPTPGKSI